MGVFTYAKHYMFVHMTCQSPLYLSLGLWSHVAVVTLCLCLFQCQHKNTTTRGWSTTYKCL